MSFNSSKNKTKSQQSSSGTSTTTVDPWAKQQFTDQTNGLLDTTMNYTRGNAPTVAGLAPMQQQAREKATGNVGNYEGLLGDAEMAAKSGVNFNAGDVSQFYNPYEQQVVDSTGAFFDEELARQLNQQNDSVAMRGAFGNVSREIGEAELRRGATMDKAKALADLKYAGHRDAVDTGFRQQAGQYQGAGILGGLAGTKQQLAANDVAMLESLGATEREIAQAQIKGELDKLLLELQVRQGILGSTPMGQTTTQSGTGQSSGTSTQTGFGASLSFGPKGLSFGG